MPQAQNGIENEVKLPLRDAADGHRRIEALGLPVRVPRIFEINVLYDTPDGRMRKAGSVLRLRKAGSRSLVTFKGPAERGKHKIREEVETTVGEFEELEKILDRLGYEPSFRYEKYRTEYARQGSPGFVTLDETPIGVFLELEGPPDWIDRVAAQLGFQESQYILKSYIRLYFEDCEQRGIAPSQMTFTKP